MDLLLHKAIFHCGRRYICSKYLLIVTLRYTNKCHTSNIFLIPTSCVGSTSLEKMSSGVRVPLMGYYYPMLRTVTDLIFIISFVPIGDNFFFHSRSCRYGA